MHKTLECQLATHWTEHREWPSCKAFQEEPRSEHSTPKLHASMTHRVCAILVWLT
jgi:hypothetical protein